VPLEPEPEQYTYSYPGKNAIPSPPVTEWEPLQRLLKGSDARVRMAAESVRLVPRVKLLCDTGYGFGDPHSRDVLLDHIVDLSNVHEQFAESSMDGMELAEDVILRKGVALQRGPERMEALKARLQYTGYWSDNGNWMDSERMMDSAEPEDNEVAVHWLAPLTYFNRVKSPYVSTGGMVDVNVRVRWCRIAGGCKATRQILVMIKVYIL
jgi:hypothetical protein